jgi:hypothetical protein
MGLYLPLCVEKYKYPHVNISFKETWSPSLTQWTPESSEESPAWGKVWEKWVAFLPNICSPGKFLKIAFILQNIEWEINLIMEEHGRGKTVLYSRCGSVAGSSILWQWEIRIRIRTKIQEFWKPNKVKVYNLNVIFLF